MTGFDMTSPSISGHQRISLNDGNIFDSILMLQPKFPKDPAAAAAAAAAAATAEDAAETAEVEDETAETADVAATASVAMMISDERKKKKFCLQFPTKTTAMTLHCHARWSGIVCLPECVGALQGKNTAMRLG